MLYVLFQKWVWVFDHGIKTWESSESWVAKPWEIHCIRVFWYHWSNMQNEFLKWLLKWKAMNQSGTVVGLGDCLINVDETLAFDVVFYWCLKAHSHDRMGLSDWVKFS